MHVAVSAFKIVSVANHISAIRHLANFKRQIIPKIGCHHFPYGCMNITINASAIESRSNPPDICSGVMATHRVADSRNNRTDANEDRENDDHAPDIIDSLRRQRIQ